MIDDAFIVDYNNARLDRELDRRDLLDEASGGDDAAADCGQFFAWPAAPPDPVCHECLGLGAVGEAIPDRNDGFECLTLRRCPVCQGRGTVEFVAQATQEWGESPCPECGGNG